MRAPELQANYKATEIAHLFKEQQDFFAMGKTLDLSFRKEALRKLKTKVKEREEDIIQALAADFGKPSFESYASEIGFLYEEINFALKHLRAWAKPKRKSSPLATWPSRSYVYPQPKGVCLIIGPWNYPFQLVLAPLVAALAAGNTCFIKPPEQTPHISTLIEELLLETFDRELVCVVQGPGHEVVPLLMANHRFDHVFFTGSVSVGRIIAQLAAPKLVPTTLELGGKSPTVIDKTAHLKVAADRIAFGKWLNAGQTCVAPDYLLVERSVMDDFTTELKKSLQSFYPEGALKSEHYTQMVNEKRFEAVKAYLKEGEILFGGETDAAQLKIAPTLLLNPAPNSAVMQEEVFGPVLPIIPYDFREDALAVIAREPNPLAFYLFSESKAEQDFWVQKLSFGGGAINNTVVHLSNPHLPFGGIGNSGIGHYHGQYGFDTFSHQKAVMKSATWFDLKQKYPPYGPLINKVIRRLMS